METNQARCANCQHWIKSLLEHRAGFGVCVAPFKHNAHEIYTAELDGCGGYELRMSQEDRKARFLSAELGRPHTKREANYEGYQ